MSNPETPNTNLTTILNTFKTDFGQPAYNILLNAIQSSPLLVEELNTAAETINNGQSTSTFD